MTREWTCCDCGAPAVVTGRGPLPHRCAPCIPEFRRLKSAKQRAENPDGNRRWQFRARAVRYGLDPDVSVRLMASSAEEKPPDVSRRFGLA